MGLFLGTSILISTVSGDLFISPQQSKGFLFCSQREGGSEGALWFTKLGALVSEREVLWCIIGAASIYDKCNRKAHGKS